MFLIIWTSINLWRWILNMSFTLLVKLSFTLACWINLSDLLKPWLLNLLVVESGFFGCWTLVAESGFFTCWTLVVESGGFGCWIRRFWLLKPWLLNPSLWLLNPAFWLLNLSCWNRVSTIWPLYVSFEYNHHPSKKNGPTFPLNRNPAAKPPGPFAFSPPLRRDIHLSCGVSTARGFGL